MLDSNANGALDDEDEVLQLGKVGDVPVAGDWHGEGRDRPGVYSDGEAAVAKTTTETASSETSE
jgi:hypothetical protein